MVKCHPSICKCRMGSGVGIGIDVGFGVERRSVTFGQEQLDVFLADKGGTSSKAIATPIPIPKAIARRATPDEICVLDCVHDLPDCFPSLRKFKPSPA